MVENDVRIPGKMKNKDQTINQPFLHSDGYRQQIIKNETYFTQYST